MYCEIINMELCFFNVGFWFGGEVGGNGFLYSNNEENYI